jgi:N4-(beta-N-acetylglucosaminyl)-L-asparaginase
MISRKEFLARTALLAGAGMAAPAAWAAAARTKRPGTSPSGTLPAVLATWDNRGATEAAMSKLHEGGSALDAVEAGARVPEADPDDQSVGYGGRPDRDGHVTLDACIMDSEGNAGAVTFLQHIMHPVSVARRVMEKTPHVTLSGEGALRFAIEQGFEKTNLLTDKSKEQWQQWRKKGIYNPANSHREAAHDTIGILAVDASGNLSGACTTSGLSYKMHGRVGDSPVIGAGMYVDNDVGAACATGVGELVLKTLGSFLIVELMRHGASPQEACEEAVQRIVKKYGSDKGQVGYLALTRTGDHGAYAVRPKFPYALFRGGENTLHEAATHVK